jgi:serine/threonine protein kinase
VLKLSSSYRATHSNSSSYATPLAGGRAEVAVKVIDTEIPAANEQQKNARKEQVKMRTQFFQEVEIMSKMQHRNICKFYGSSVDGPNWCLVCDFMINGDLYSRLGQWDPSGSTPLLRVAPRVKIILGIVKGLTYLHRQGVIHRDVKCVYIYIYIRIRVRVQAITNT